ncbi:hypothetical protein HEBU111660_08105 [Helicobacter burdigaliensis]
MFADGNNGIGLGHISRTKALQSLLERCGIKTLLFQSDTLEQNLRTCDIIVIDSYVLPLSAYKLAQNYAKHCIFLDDTFRLDYPTNSIILNSSLGANLKEYQKVYPLCRLWIGKEFFLLQEEFLKALNSTPPPLLQTPKNILLTLGGEDILGLLPTICKFSFLSNFTLHCISKTPMPPPIITHYNLNPKQMRILMQNMDICISAGGQTLGELLACGIPTIALEITQNQAFNIQGFKECILSIHKVWKLNKIQLQQKLEEKFLEILPLTLRKNLRKNIAISLKNKKTLENHIKQLLDF